MPNFPIIDAHVHVFDPTAIRFDWMQHVPALNKPHSPHDFRTKTKGIDIEGFVFVEVDAAAGQHLREAEWVADVAAHEPMLKAMVASMPMETGNAVEADLAKFAKLKGARGVRRLIQTHIDEPAWCLKRDFITAVKLLPQYNLTFDLCIFHPQLNDVIALVDHCPDVAFVLDHIGKPGIKAGLHEAWKRELVELAKRPNVMCKISGVVTEADHATWMEEQVTPYIAHAIEAFGFDRVMFGGDWPVSELATSYQRWVALVDEVVKGANEADKKKLFRENAIAFYRLAL
jgi:L-fuconolactonase